MRKNKLKKEIKSWLAAFMIILFLSGATAIPVVAELNWALQLIPSNTILFDWLHRVLQGFADMQSKHPFLMYGYDWLAFAHFVLAILFIGPYRNPVQNVWVIQFGLIACVLILPFAIVAGHFRSIPFWWRLGDCSFGIIGFVVLWICYQKIQKLSILSATNESL